MPEQFVDKVEALAQDGLWKYCKNHCKHHLPNCECDHCKHIRAVESLISAAPAARETALRGTQLQSVARALARQYWLGRGETITKEQEDEFWLSFGREAEFALAPSPVKWICTAGHEWNVPKTVCPICRNSVEPKEKI